jgi:hypothetical protein
MQADLATMAYYAGMAEAEIASRHSTFEQGEDDSVLDDSMPSHTLRNDRRTPGAGEGPRRRRGLKKAKHREEEGSLSARFKASFPDLNLDCGCVNVCACAVASRHES